MSTTIVCCFSPQKQAFIRTNARSAQCLPLAGAHLKEELSKEFHLIGEVCEYFGLFAGEYRISLNAAMKKGKKLRKPHRQTNSPEKRFWKIHDLDILEKIALVLGLWLLIFPRPYKELLTILLIIPLFGLILNGLNGRPSFASLFRITGKDDQTKLDLADFIDYPPWVLLLRILLDFEFDAYKSMVVPGLIACLLVIGFLFITHRGIGQGVEYRRDMYVLAIANIVVYAIAGAFAVNCVYDNKPSEKHYTTVISKHVSKGRRSTTYRVKVQPWGHHFDTESISIDANQYYSIEKGDTVQIDMHKGLLGIPWYHIAKPKSSNDIE